MRERVKSTVKENKHAKKQDKQANRQTNRKPFDKKKYRLQKYSNKFKVDQWEDRRKKAVLRGFYKQLHKDQRNKNEQPLTENNSEENGETSGQVDRKPNAFYKAKQEFLRKKAEKYNKKEEIEKRKAEKQEALQNYKQKKMQTYKKLSKKTKKGQPVMKDRLQMLLEKIQASVD